MVGGSASRSVCRETAVLLLGRYILGTPHDGWGSRCLDHTGSAGCDHGRCGGVIGTRNTGRERSDTIGERYCPRTAITNANAISEESDGGTDDTSPDPEHCGRGPECPEMRYELPELSVVIGVVAPPDEIRSTDTPDGTGTDKECIFVVYHVSVMCISLDIKLS